MDPEGSSASSVSESLYSGMVALAADALISTDETGRITSFNRGAEKIFGRAAEEVLGQPLDLLLPERFVAPHREHLRAFAAGQVPVRLASADRPRIVGRRRNGEEFPAEASISRQVVEGKCVLTVALRDVTDQRDLQRSQRFLLEVGTLLGESLDLEATLQRTAELAVSGIADGCVIWLKSGERELRPAAAHHVAPEKRALLAQLTPIHPTGEEGSLRVVRTGEPRFLPELGEEHLRLLAGDEDHLRLLRACDLRSYLSVPLARGGVTFGTISLFSGPTARRLNERDLALAQDFARRASLALENARLYAEAQRATRARDEVLGVVAHDLRNMLASITLAGQLLVRASPDSPPARTVLRVTQRMRRLVDDLLDLGQIEAHALRLARRAEPAGALLAAARAAALELGTDHEIRAEVPGALPSVWADADRVLQVFSNLVGNALKFTPVGGRVTLGACAEEGRVCFWVEDTGPGVPEQDRPRVFDRFWQGAPRDTRGAGLGLTICRGIVEAHGGQIELEPTSTRGARFSFTLPTAPS